MVKYFCDGCGKELAKGDADRVRHEAHINGTTINVQVMTGVEGVWNSGYVCHECVVRVVTGDTAKQTDVASLEQAIAAKDTAYAERDRLVAALSKCFPSHLVQHQGADWEDDWRNIVCIHLPTGHVTWHIHDSEVEWFSHLPTDGLHHWDGHTTAEKYERLAALNNAAPMESGQFYHYAPPYTPTNK